MARWLVLPILGCMLAGGAAHAQRDPKPGVSAPVPATERPAPRRRIYRAPPQAVAPEPAFQPPPTSYSDSRALRPSPSDPYRGVTLPRQSGDAAYQGGGMVLEQDDSGMNRRVR